MTVNTYVDEDGRLHYVNINACSDCGIEIIEDGYIVESDDGNIACLLITVSIDGETIFAWSDELYWD